MIEKKNLSLTYKLLFSFLLISFISIAILLVTSGNISSQHIKQQTIEELEIVSQLKKNEIETYFKEKIFNIEMLSFSDETRRTYLELESLNDSSSIRNKDPFNVRNEEYIKVYNKNVTYFSKFISTYSFDDLYLINIENGQIMFSVKKKKDFGSNIRYGKYKNTHLAEIWKQTIKTCRTNIVDFQIYEPSENQMVMFIATPLYVKDPTTNADVLKAIVVAQISPKDVNHIVQERIPCLKKTGELFIMGNSSLGKIELRSDKVLVSEKIGDLKTGRFFDAALIKGESGYGIDALNNGEHEYVVYVPLNIKDLNWAIFTTIEESEVLSPINNIWMSLIIVAIILFFIIVLIGIYLANRVSKPIIEISHKLKLLSKGILPKYKFKVNTGSEIGQIQSTFNDLVEGQKKYIEFADSIGKGKLDIQFKKISEEDMLGESLIRMKDSIERANNIALNQQKEEVRQRWMTEGIAKFSDILRQNYNGLTFLADNIIKNIVEFLDVNQGGIFTYTEKNGEQKIELLSCFAYDRKKYIKKEIAIGEGLLGACFYEKETIHLKNIPEDYPNISSGLGSAKPKEVLIIPLKIETKVLGVIELVSFKEFDSHVIAFTEKIAENIASSIASSQINERTKELLEESKLKSEQMAAQEEEMRQNMEELQATQEESGRREAETSNILEVINKTVYIAYFSLEGTILSMNQMFLKALHVTENEVVGLDYKMFNPNVQSPTFWDDIIAEEEVQLVSKIKTKSSEIVLKENFFLIKNLYDDPVKIISIAVKVQ